MNVKTDNAKNPDQKTGVSQEPSAGRPTIGFLCGRLVDDYSVRVWNGVCDGARASDVNLICFIGGILQDPFGFRSQANVLYSLINEEKIDGLVFWGAQLVHYTTPEDLRQICDRYKSLPVVNIGLDMEGIPGLLMDNYQGMRDVVSHLITVHDRRRIAYVGGPGDTPEVRERYRGYVDALAQHNIPFDQSLVVLWDESMYEAVQRSVEPGEAGIKVLLDERGLQPKKDFDALLGHDDGLTKWMLPVLQSRGFNIPADLSVGSFDDIPQAQYFTPPLTTARQSFYELGRKGVELLLNHLLGDGPLVSLTLPMEVVIRRSCGCFDLSVMEAGEQGEVPAQPVGQKDPQTVLAEKRENVISEMALDLSKYEQAAGWMARIFDAFVADLFSDNVDGASDIFLQDLIGVLNQALEASGYSVGEGSEAKAWQKAFSVLRSHLRPHLQSYLGDDVVFRAEGLLQQARVLVGEMMQQAHVYRHLQTERQIDLLRSVNQTLLTAFEVEELLDVLETGLGQVGIPTCHLALYEDSQPYKHLQPASEWAHLIFAYQKNERVALPAEGGRILSQQLIPKDLWPNDRQYSFVIEPLYFCDYQIGFGIFEMGPSEGTVYEMLRGDLSSALYGGLLLQAQEKVEQELRGAYSKVEQQVADRTARLQQEIAERERAQADNLRLQQQVIEAQQRSIQELSTPIIPVMDRVIIMPLIGSIDTLRARDVTRRLLSGIREHRARVVILDVTGVPVVDSNVADALNKTIQAARLKGARTVITGVSDAVAETIVDLAIDWGEIDTLRDLQTGLQLVLSDFLRRAEAF
jgi:DNA-binding LacI/PurR family transcriptional regulator/anti-anti-sigma regulatory factor